MIDKDEIIKKYLENASETIGPIRQKTSKFDKLFGDNKIAIIDLVKNKSKPIKALYNDLVARKIIEDSPYISFYQWVKKNLKDDEDRSKNLIAQQSVELLNNVDDNNDAITVDSTKKAIADSREMFYGFDMNNDPDIVTNPLPQLYEISKEYIFNIFTNDTTLNNEKIVYILLYEISASGNNKFKDIWHLMLMQNGENIQQYYDRLQEVINSNGSYSFGITNATASISDIAFACGCDKYKIIRRNVQ